MSQFTSQAATPTRRGYNNILLNDATGMIKKNETRRSIILLDKLFLQCQQKCIPGEMNIQLCRRLVKQCQKLVDSYVRQDHMKHTDMLLNRCNLYITAQYISIQHQLIKKNNEINEMEEPHHDKKLGIVKLKQKLRQSIVVQGNFYSVDEIKRLGKNSKIKFYLHEFLSLVMNQLAVYANLMKHEQNIQGCLKMLKKLSAIVKKQEFKQINHIFILKSIIQYYQQAAALYFQLCEFRLAIENYNIAIEYVQKLINLILAQQKCPKQLEPEDLESVIPWFLKLVFLLNLESYCYEYHSEYSKMFECLNLAIWILDELLRVAEDNQLRILITSRIQDTQPKYIEVIEEEAEVVHFIKEIFGDLTDIVVEYKQSVHEKQDNFTNTLNYKFYNKYKIEQLNKQQLIVTPQDRKFHHSKQKSTPLCYLNVGSKTERDLRQQSGTYLSFTTQDFENDHLAKRFMTFESDHNSKTGTVILSKKLSQDYCSNTPSKPQIKTTDISKLFLNEGQDKVNLNNQLSNLISKRLRTEPQIYQLQGIIQDQERQQDLDCQLKRKVNTGRSIIGFRRNIQYNMTEEKESELTSIQLYNRIKNECAIIENCIDAEELLKKQRQEVPIRRVQSTDNLKGHNKFRKILIKHSLTLGLKKMKKHLIQQDEESALKHLMSKMITTQNQEKSSFQAKQKKLDEQTIMKKTMQTNLNTIKYLMDDNEKEQENAMRQLRHRHHQSINLYQDKRKERQSKQFKLVSQFSNLADSTNYFSDQQKKMTSISDIANVKRKLIQMEKRKTIKYSEVILSELE